MKITTFSPWFFLMGVSLFAGPSLGWSQRLGAGPAVSSEAAATQPKIPEQLPSPAPQQTKLKLPPATGLTGSEAIDPLLDPARPRNSQLTIEKEQTVRCGEIEVVLPPGVYKQILLVENPEGRRATDTTGLQRQQTGLGYIRYLSDEKLKIGGELRVGGIDVGIRAEDKLPARIWYKKMTQPDDLTKAFTFILPPVGLIAGAGAWSSGNTLLPDSPLLFTEARDYFLREPTQTEAAAKPAFQSRPAEPKTEPGARANR